MDQRLPKVATVKNKQPSDRQITAEQILREAKEIKLEEDFKAPKTIITDPQELAEYRLKKRKEFEDAVRRVGRFTPTLWVKYANWEEQQKDFRRARSVWERALGVEHRNVSYWIKYAEMEMRHRFLNHARNVWDRAVSLLPRVDQLWYRYVHMEEMLGNVAGTRQIFERWMRFEPDHTGWMAYIKFELRYEEVERARQIYERYVQILPSVKAWVRYAKFEMKNGEIPSARQCYERAVEELGEDAQTEEFFLRFAEFEEKVKEVERARAIYKYALDHIPKAQAPALYERFTLFEKQHGDRDGIESVVISKRRFQYEEEVARNPLNYDTWFDYIKLEESGGDIERTREVYERAVAQLPPGFDKRLWRRYIYLWIKYALFEEVDAEDMERARDVYRVALQVIPHRTFTFSKVWVLAAKFEVRARDVGAARRLLGEAIGRCPKDKTFREYIELELSMGEIPRVRKLYEKYLEFNVANVDAWVKWAGLEADLGEVDRARFLFEAAIAQPVLDMPEALWKAYIDFEIGQCERQRARILYTRLLDRTKHVKVWLSYAKFEASPMQAPGEGGAPGAQDSEGASASGAPEEGEEGEEAPRALAARARTVYAQAFRTLRELTPDLKAEAQMVLEAWRDFEASCTASSSSERAAALDAIAKKLPRRVKRRRAVRTEDGMEVGTEEYYDYVFPEEGAAAPSLKLLEKAYAWRQGKRPAWEDQDTDSDDLGDGKGDAPAGSTGRPHGPTAPPGQLGGSDAEEGRSGPPPPLQGSMDASPDVSPGASPPQGGHEEGGEGRLRKRVRAETEPGQAVGEGGCPEGRTAGRAAGAAGQGDSDAADSD